MFTRVRRVSCCALAVAAAALLTTSCGGGSGAYSGSMTSITLGALPVVDDVSAYIAANEGIFQKYGLNVTIKQVLTSAVAIPEMKNGAIDILGGGNYVSFIEASAKNPAAPYRILSEAATCASGSFEILTLPSSGIQTPAGLERKTIAVNLTNNIQTLMINSVLASDDVQATDVRYVAIPFPKMVAALEAHKVDAISVVEPFATTAEQEAGAIPILDQCSGPDSNLPLSGYISTSAWAQQHPDAVQRFQQAMAQAQEISDTDRAVVEKTLLKYVTGLTPVQAATITLEQFPTSLDGPQLNRVSNLMQEAGLINPSVQASSLINR